MNKQETMQKQDNIQNKKHGRKYKLAAGIVLLLLIFVALIYALLTQEPKPDPTSEALIRAEVAAQLNKDPNELTDEDFTKFTEFHFDLLKEGRLPRIIVGRSQNVRLAVIELSDIKLLEKFTNLQNLHLNNITYPDKNIPKWMKILANFGLIDLADRFSIDLSPLEKLYFLDTVTFYMVPIKNIRPLSKLTNLERLSLDYTDVYDLEPIKDLTKLKILNISHTQVADLEPIRNLKNLTELNLYNSKVVNIEPVSGLVNLETLNLQKTHVSDIIPLKGLTKLQKLDWEGTQVTDLGPLSELKNLSQLNLNDTPLKSLEPLRGLTKVEILRINLINITDLTPLEGMKSLKSVGFRNYDHITDEQIADLRKAFPGLQIYYFIKSGNEWSNTR